MDAKLLNEVKGRIERCRRRMEAHFGITLTDDDTAEILCKTIQAKPDVPCHYGDLAMFHLAIDRSRALERQPLRDARLAFEEHYQERREKALAELRDLLAWLTVREDLTATQKCWLEIIRIEVFSGRMAKDQERDFPGTTIACRWMWKKRGLDLLLPFASSQLREVLISNNTHRTGADKLRKLRKMRHKAHEMLRAPGFWRHDGHRLVLADGNLVDEVTGVVVVDCAKGEITVEAAPRVKYAYVTPNPNPKK